MGNFNGQWIEIFSAGQHTDDQGRIHTISPTFLQQVVTNFNASIHESPAVIGHPKDNSPAYGWVSDLRVSDGKLEVKLKDVDPDFEKLVRDGRYKKRSASFYVDKSSVGSAPYLRHVGFLGAAPPAVKGLRDIQFTEGDALTFEFSEGESSMGLEEKEVNGIVDKVVEKIKSIFGGSKSGDQAASFSEAEVTRLIADAVGKVEIKFTEQITQRDTMIGDLKKKVDEQGLTTARASIIAFCERLGASKFPPAFKRMGVIDFMEGLAAVDQKVSVISFTEKDGKEVEEKKEVTLLNFFESFLEGLGPFISFGESLGSLTATSDADAFVSKERKAELREKAGLPAEGGAE
jgi:hypothetical protein